MKKRKIVISIDDNCEEPFELTDINHWSQELNNMLMEYDIEITKIEVKEADETN